MRQLARASHAAQAWRPHGGVLVAVVQVRHTMALQHDVMLVRAGALAALASATQKLTN